MPLQGAAVDRLGLATGGIGYCAASLVEGLDGEPLMGKAFPGGQGFPDLHAVGDLASARIAPWQPDTLWLLADLVEAGGVPSPLCMRGVLRRVTERLASHGLRAMVASEPVFYVLRVGEGRAIEHYSPLAGMAYTTGVRADPTGLVRRIHAALDEFGLGVTTALREFSPGQFEINLAHAEALTAADNAFLLEEVVKEIAASEGLLATFMAKPLAGSEGSSHHVHASLWRGEDNAFDDDGQIDPDAAPPLPLPRSLDAALVVLEEDSLPAAMLGEQLLGAMVAVKRRELERFGLAVTDWEWREYATHA